jgi:flavin-dependent dehydrogenase
MTGECGGVLRVLGLEDKMLKTGHPVKQGVKVFGSGGTNKWWVPVMARDADWNLHEQFTWQVRRSDFDAMMLREATARGATLVQGRATRPLLKDDGSVRGVEVLMADGHREDIESEVLLDCSGQATWLANLGGVTGPKYLGSYDKQIAIFSQVAGAIRDDDSSRENHPDNTLIFYQKKYHWTWFIPLDADVVSVGVVTPAAYFRESKESKRDFLIREMHEINPEMDLRLPNVELVEDVHVIPNYSYQVRGFTGKGFICIGDAHRFIDPIFSFGLYVAIKEAQLMAPAVLRYLEGWDREGLNPFASYQLEVERGIDVLEDMIDYFWEFPLAFARAVHFRYRELLTDVFAGRIYERQPSEAVMVIRETLRRERQRSQEDPDEYSVPIGSRFHPERAPLWQAKSIDESTEAWMGPR